VPLLDLVDRIHSARPLPDAQERVARHLEVHYEELPFESAHRLAQAAGVSKATVIRLVQHLGYAGLDDLRDVVREALYSRSDSPAARYEALTNTRDVGHILEEFRRHEQRNLRRTLERLEPDRVHALCSDLIRARCVWVFGQRFSYGIAFNLALLLAQVLPQVENVAAEGGTLADRAAAMTREDHLLIVAHRRVGADKARLAAYARARDIPYTLITDMTSDAEGLLAGARHVLTSCTDAYGVFNSYAPTYGIVQAIASVLELLAPGAPGRLTEAEIALRSFRAFASEGR